MHGYLRVLDNMDLQNTNNLHRVIHGWNKILGLLDCLHIVWNNCLKAWNGSCKGKENSPSITLEGISDHHFFMYYMDMLVP